MLILLKNEMITQVLHGCRQLVPWGVPFSGVTSATPVLI